MHQNTRSRYAIPEKRARQIPVQSYDTPIYTWHSHIHTKSQLGYYTLTRDKDVTANIHFSCLLQRSTPYAVTDSLCSPEDGHNDARSMLRQKLIINIWLFSVDKKNQLDVTFCILYFSSNGCSTCFGQPCAYHQELTTAWYYSLVLVCAVAAGRLSSPVGR